MPPFPPFVRNKHLLHAKSSLHFRKCLLRPTTPPRRLSLLCDLTAMDAAAKVITAANASQCTPYELRQELNRRGAMDLPENNINYKTLLQRLMVEFVKDEEKQNEERRIEIERKQKEERDRLKEEREKRKQEALERSRQRREADPQYFEKRKPLVEEASMAAAAPGSVAEVPSEAAEEEEEEEEQKVLDPFRSYQPKTRNKVFVK